MALALVDAMHVHQWRSERTLFGDIIED